MYGLKQSPRAWFGKFSQALVGYGMQKSTSDHSLFDRQSDNGTILLVVYVDDIVTPGNNASSISSFKIFLQGQFHTKDLGQLKYFLRIEVMRSKMVFICLNENMYLICCLR